MERYLDEIVAYLREHPVELSSNDADGRVNSGVNEHEILEELQESPYRGIIDIPQARAWYDFSIANRDGELFVNIKVSDLSNSAADNLSSKKGMGYALTGIKNLPNNWPDFNAAVSSNIRRGFDYYYLVVNKNNPSDVFWTSLKRIGSLQPNGSNPPFQCNWGANRQWAIRTEEEAIEYILRVFLDSWDLRCGGYPGEIKTMLDRGEIHSRLRYS